MHANASRFNKFLEVGERGDGDQRQVGMVRSELEERFAKVGRQSTDAGESLPDRS